MIKLSTYRKELHRLTNKGPKVLYGCFYAWHIRVATRTPAIQGSMVHLRYTELPQRKNWHYFKITIDLF